MFEKLLFLLSFWWCQFNTSVLLLKKVARRLRRTTGNFAPLREEFHAELKVAVRTCEGKAIHGIHRKVSTYLHVSVRIFFEPRMGTNLHKCLAECSCLTQSRKVSQSVCVVLRSLREVVSHRNTRNTQNHAERDCFTQTAQIFAETCGAKFCVIQCIAFPSQVRTATFSSVCK